MYWPIEWDGRHHRVPIHENLYFNNRENRDRIKDKIVVNDFKGVMIRVRDDGREDLDFVGKKIKKIKQLINNSMNENKIINI